MVQTGRHSFDYPDREAHEASRRGELSPLLAELILPDATRLSEVASALDSSDEVTRADAAAALGSAFRRRSAATLVSLVSQHLVSDPSETVRSSCAWCLCQWGEFARPVLAELIEATQDDNPSVRLWSVRSLSRLNLKRDEVLAVLPALACRLTDIDCDVRFAAHEGVAAHCCRL